MKVLLVEDNEMNRDMLSRRLERKGHEVLIAVDGQEAIAMTRQHRPAVVLMDMSLPVLDGWEATRRLKTDETTRAIPVIALTAHALPGERERALEAGCVAFETKPIDFPKLLAAMESVAK
jgi:CheY-like chemotaxis protein